MDIDMARSKAWSLMIALFRESSSDGKIDFDEGRILESVNLNVNELIKYLKLAWEDRILTETERKDIQFLIRKIEDDAESLANFDNIITETEESLLEIIRDVIESFAEERIF